MKKYQIIYADPPWEYNDKKNNDPAMGGITYPTMALEDIKNLDVKDIADDNCVLFLWATMPLLKEGIEVVEAWGFRYITCAFVWVKMDSDGVNIHSGMGHWVNGNAELVLLGKKGHPQRIRKNIKQIQCLRISEHSKKPDKIRQEIVRLMGDLPRIELFARGSKERDLFNHNRFDGWDCWGNEVESDIEL